MKGQLSGPSGVFANCSYLTYTGLIVISHAFLGTENYASCKVEAAIIAINQLFF